MATDFEFRIKQQLDSHTDSTMPECAFRTFAKARDHGIRLMSDRDDVVAIEVVMHTLVDGKIIEAHTIEVLRRENLLGRSDLGVGNECAG